MKITPKEFKDKIKELRILAQVYRETKNDPELRQKAQDKLNSYGIFNLNSGNSVFVIGF
jgi:hypothetical protein